MTDASNMPARIWAWGGTASGWTPRKFINEIPAREYVRADIVEAMAEALRKAEHLYTIGILNAPDGLPAEVVALRRSALTSYREASNDHVA